MQTQEKLNSLFEFENLWDLDYICTYVQDENGALNHFVADWFVEGHILIAGRAK